MSATTHRLRATTTVLPKRSGLPPDPERAPELTISRIVPQSHSIAETLDASGVPHSPPWRLGKGSERGQNIPQNQQIRFLTSLSRIWVSQLESRVRARRDPPRAPPSTKDHGREEPGRVRKNEPTKPEYLLESTRIHFALPRTNSRSPGNSTLGIARSTMPGHGGGAAV